MKLENKLVSPKETNNKFEIKPWTKKNVENDLNEQINLLYAGRNNYKTVAKLAAGYRMTSKAFRNRCADDNDLMNLFEIYNGVYVEHIMTQAIKDGKINSQTEDFLREEMQAFTNTGTEQLVQWIVEKQDNNFYILNEETGKYDIPVKITTQKEENEGSGIFGKTVEVNNE